LESIEISFSTVQDSISYSSFQIQSHDRAVVLHHSSENNAYNILAKDIGE